MGWFSDVVSRWWPPVRPIVPPSSSFDPEEVEELLTMHNAARMKAGKPLLRAHPKLQAAAQGHAQQMARQDQLAHAGIGDGTASSRITQAGYRFSAVAENIAWNASTAEEVMSIWLSSAMHHANIVGPYSDFGAAASVNRKGEPYWCTVFGEA